MSLNINSWTLFLVNVVLKFLDVTLTTYIVTICGVTAESNSLIRNTIENYGLIPTMIAIMIAHTGLMWLLYRRNRKDLLLIVAILMFLLVITNTLTAIIQ